MERQPRGEEGASACAGHVFIEVHLIRVLAVNTGHVDRHRAINVHRHAREAPLGNQPANQQGDELGAGDCERRNEHGAAPLDGLRERSHELVLQRLVLMLPVTIGGFEHEGIAARERVRVTMEGDTVAAEVAAEHERMSLSRKTYLDMRGPEDVASIVENNFHAREFERMAVSHIFEQPQRAFRVVNGEERESRVVLGIPLPVRVRRILFLDAGGIRQEDPRKVGRRRRRVDRSPEAFFDKAGQHSGVIDMRVREENSIQFTRIERRLVPVAEPKLLEPLELAAIDKYARIVRFEQETRAGHSTGRTMKGNGGHRDSRHQCGVAGNSRWRVTTGSLAAMALYDSIGRTYSATRRSDPRIHALLWQRREGCKTVLNVGAGTGNYEERGRVVAAVEPSRTMIGQRPPDSAPAVMAVAERLPLADQSVDGVMSVLSTHHWRDRRAGIIELRRVARRAVVILTHDPDGSAEAWILRDYFPEAIALDRPNMDFEGVCRELGATSVTPVPVPWDCRDGFFLAFWRHPEAYLDPEVRAGMSIFKRLSEAQVEEGVGRLRDDLASGAWQRRNVEILNREAIDVGYRLVTWRAS